jgi:hypothetical protein
MRSMVMHRLRTHVYRSVLQLESCLASSFSSKSNITVTESYETRTFQPYSLSVDRMDNKYDLY